MLRIIRRANKNQVVRNPVQLPRSHPFRQPTGQYSPEQVNAMYAAKLAGRTYADIGKEFRCSGEMVSLILRSKVRYYKPVTDRFPAPPPRGADVIQAAAVQNLLKGSRYPEFAERRVHTSVPPTRF